MIDAIISRRMDDNLAWGRRQCVVPPIEDAGDPWSAIAAIWDTPDEEFLAGLFQALFCRPIDEGALAHCLRVLQSGTVSRADLVRDLAASPEAQNTWIDHSWLRMLDTKCARSMWASVCHVYRLPDDAFLEGLWDLLLRRPITAEERSRHAADARSAARRKALIDALAQSSESRAHALDASWRKRLADIDGPRLLVRWGKVLKRSISRAVRLCGQRFRRANHVAEV